jgi:hypothetical protein
VLDHIGDHGESSRILEKILRKNQSDLDAISVLAGCPTYPDGMDLKSMIDALASEQRSKKDRANFLFARSTIYHKVGEFEKSWEFLLQVNKIFASLNREQIKRNREWEKESLEYFRSYRPQRKVSDAEKQTLSLFIWGPSRSGKTTIEALLGRSDDVKMGTKAPLLQMLLRKHFKLAGLFQQDSWCSCPTG